MIRKIKVNTQSYSYDVNLGSSLNYGELLRNDHEPCKLTVISDETVFGLYGEAVVKSLEAAGFDVVTFVFKPGEESKNLDVFGEIMEFLAANKLSRSDVLVALGGGVVGDITGFCAASYLRGVDYVQIPTTLLAMVDSSVGGKTGVDLAAGKNLVGAIHQPLAVYVDTAVLSSIPHAVIADGMAEVVKYGVISDAELFETLESGSFDMADVIYRCIELKAITVEADEFDVGQRMILNFGHTAGHAIEVMSEYKLSHGAAVSVGMVLETEVFERHGVTKVPFSSRLRTLLAKFDLPTEYSADLKRMVELMLSDKKRFGNKITLIAPTELGKCDLYAVCVPAHEQAGCLSDVLYEFMVQ